MKILVINGPNLNLLGIREPHLYGTESYDALCLKIKAYAAKKQVEVSIFQSNHEGALVDAVQGAYGTYDALILNPAAYTHTSIALLDALRAVSLPAVEVHLTDIDAREPFRKISYIRDACIASVVGHGTDGYLEAMELLLAHLRENT